MDVGEKSRPLGKGLGTLNTTFIALIPKKQKCDTFDNYRPISLCNLIYRIISKRLKGIISGFVSEDSSTRDKFLMLLELGIAQERPESTEQYSRILSFVAIQR